MTGSKPTNWGIVGWIALATLNCALIVPWLSRLVPQPRDFNAFYMAAQMYRHSPGHSFYDQRLQLRAEQQMFGFDDTQASKYFLPFNHLPYELVLWLPLTALPFRAAFWVWRIGSMILLAAMAWLLIKTLDLKRAVAIVFVISLAFFPVPSSLMTGQDTCVSLLLFAICLWLLKAGRNFYAGAVLGLGLFKLQLVVPIIGILLLCRYWRVVAGFVCSASALLAVSTAMVGSAGMKSLLRLWMKGESGTLFCIRPALMPNLRGLLTVTPGVPPHLVTIATFVASSLLLLLAAKQARAASSPEHMLAICLCFVALVSFHTNVYDLSILILPILLLLEAFPTASPRQRWITMPPVILLFCTPLYVLAAATIKIGLLAILVAWLWYAVSYGTREREAADREAFARAPEFAVGL